MKPNSTNTFTPGPAPNTVRAADGKILSVPEGWVLLPPGDAALTRRVLEGERSTEGFTKKKVAVVAFLGFHANHADLADRLARVVTDHATPVGSGTVARTKRIPVEQRAEAAVIAWLRHSTTGYDGMAIPRVKGKRREVRRMLARRSHELLERYRRGEATPEACPLKKALTNAPSGQADFLTYQID